MQLLRGERFDLMISDINLNAQSSGLDLLRAFKSEHPAAHVLLISGFGTLETAIEAVRAGAFDYISKPFNIAEIKAMVDRALAHTAESPTGTPAPGRRRSSIRRELIGRTAAMLAVYKQIALRRRLRRRRSSSSARAAPARSWSRARFTPTAGARRVRSSPQLRRDRRRRSSSRSSSGIRAGAFTGAIARPQRHFRAGDGRDGLPRRDRRNDRWRCRCGCCGRSKRAKCGRSAATDAMQRGRARHRGDQCAI